MNRFGDAAPSLRRDPSSQEQVIDEVFSNPAYDRYLENVEADLDGLEALLAMIASVFQWFVDLGGRLSGLSSTQPALFWLIVIGLCALLALLVWHIGYSISLAFRGGQATTQESAAKGDEGPVRAKVLVQEAAALAADGVYAEALRYLLLALVAHTQDTDRRLLASWTNREILARLQVDQQFRDSLGRFVHTVDRVWYGFHTATVEDYRNASAFVESYLQGRVEAVRSRTDV